MEEKPYYEQEYQGSKSAVPDPRFSQIIKLLFTAPFKWNARSTRKGFWVSYALTYIFEFIALFLLFAMIILLSIVGGSDEGMLSETEFIVWSVIAIVGIVAALVLFVWVNLGQLGFTIRRFHDTNHSGWWFWIKLVPFGWLVFLYFMVVPTLEKPVRWGGYLFKEKSK